MSFGHDVDMADIVGECQSLNILLSRRDVLRLRPRQWLNDKIIDVFFDQAVHYQSITEAGVHACSTLFFTILSQYGYGAVRRWTKSLYKGGGLGIAKRVIIPIHKGANHWILVSVEPQSKRIVFYDSLGGPTSPFTQHIRSWISNKLEEEGGVLNVGNDYEVHVLSGPVQVIRLPLQPTWTMVEYGSLSCLQQNHHDCGMFVCLVGARLIAGGTMTNDIIEADMPRWRERMACELSNKKHTTYNYITNFASAFLKK